MSTLSHFGPDGSTFAIYRSVSDGELGGNVIKTDGGRPRFARGRATTTLIEGTLGDF
jgi:hypothetical protein